jgi:hypothetical protein
MGQVIYFSFAGGYITLVPALGYLLAFKLEFVVRSPCPTIVSVIHSAQLAKKPGLHAKRKAPFTSGDLVQ